MKQPSRMPIRQMLNRYDSMRTIMLGEGLLVGVVAGLVTIFYRIALAKADALRNVILDYCQGNVLRMALWMAALVGMAYLVARLIRWEPMVSGSGIPQVEAEITGYIHPPWKKIIVAKIATGCLGMFGGLALGREGPSVQLGGMSGKGVAQVLKRFRLEENFLITCGASAGLTAAFNTPLAGVMFALEEIHKNFSAMVLLSCMSAALVADYLSKGIFGMEPVLSFSVKEMIPLGYYPMIILLGLLCGVLGVIFNKVLASTQDMYKKISFLPDWVCLSIPFLCAGVLGFSMRDMLGDGHVMVEKLYEGNLVLMVLVGMLLVKFVFFMISFCSGAPGGNFFPMLVLGSYVGACFGVAMIQCGLLEEKFLFNIIIIAMAALFSAIVRAPVTGIVLISEMTGSFTHMLSLAVASLIAYVVADMLGSKPVYEALTERFLVNTGNKVRAVEKQYRGEKTMLTFIVEKGSEADGCCLKDLILPSRCLVISVTRGGEELIPRGDLALCAGDTLVTLVNESDMLAMESVIRHKVTLDETRMEDRRT